MKWLIALFIAFHLLQGQAEARVPRIGEQVPVISLPTLADNQITTGSLRGKSQVIYFWTDACGCREQLLELRPFIASLKSRPLAFLTVNVGQDKARVARFVADNKIPYQVLLDDKARVARDQFSIKVLPTIFIISKDGVLREKLIGVVDTKKLQTLIGRYL
jgi:peroxiredoxin